MASSAPVVALTIDGKDVSGRTDETILQVARQNNIDIATLCELEGLSGWGACRLCLVEVTGSRRLLPACVTPITDGMEVKTDSERLRKYRRMTMELLFSEGNHVCSICVANGNCELQSLAQYLGITHIDVPYRFAKLDFDASHDLFRFDRNRCILCTRCVRVCDEIEGAHTRDVMGRGIESRIITDMNQPWGESTSCTACGKCVRVCPTGALTRRATGRPFADQKDETFLPYLRKMRGADNGGSRT